MTLKIEGKYEVLSELGEGSFGKIFKGVNVNTGVEIAVKIEKDEGGILLKNEAYMYRQLSDMTGIPTMRSFGVEDKYTYLVMDLLGGTLEELLQTHGGKMPLRMAIIIGLQMMKRVEELHKRGIIHRDIKPDNFLFGRDSTKSVLHIVDFGLAKYYVDSNKKHIERRTGRKMTGTSRYVSVNIHNGITPSRRDDVESVGYIMLYLLDGVLPWQNILCSDSERNEIITDYKKTDRLWEHFQHHSGEFITFIQYCRKLEFDEEPNYLYLNGLLKNLLRTMDLVTK
jgi:serine/threonine protein kinase